MFSKSLSVTRFFLMLSFVFTFHSCKKDKPDDDPDPQNPVQPVATDIITAYQDSVLSSLPDTTLRLEDIILDNGMDVRSYLELNDPGFLTQFPSGRLAELSAIQMTKEEQLNLFISRLAAVSNFLTTDEQHEHASEGPDSPAQRGLGFSFGSKDYDIRQFPPAGECRDKKIYGLDGSGMLYAMTHLAGLNGVEAKNRFSVVNTRDTEKWNTAFKNSAYDSLHMADKGQLSPLDFENGDIIYWESQVGFLVGSVPHFLHLSHGRGVLPGCSNNLNGDKGPRTVLISQAWLDAFGPYTIFRAGFRGLPVVTTSDIHSITATSAISGGFISNEGGSPVTARGVCWATHIDPVVENDFFTGDGTGGGGFSSNIGPLQENQSCFVRAYATNSSGTAYGLTLSFTASQGGTVTDIDGNVYPTVTIGTQEWMAENLKTTRYRDGSTILHVTGDTAWRNLSIGAWCNNDNNASNDLKYGKLYNWYAVSDPRELCPAGWHVPSDAEWKTLEQYLGMSEEEANESGQLRGGEANVGGKLKAVTGWNAPNGGATNSSGFTGLPGGWLESHFGSFDYVGPAGYWWTSSEYGSVLDIYYAGYRMLLSAGGYVGWYAGDQRHGLSVRCLRD